MRKPLIKSVIVILVLELLLIGFSVYYPTMSQLLGRSGLYTPDFFTLSELFDFRKIKRNEKADIIIKNLKDKTAESIEFTDALPIRTMPLRSHFDTVVKPMKTSAYLIVPEIEKGHFALDDFFQALYSVSDSLSLHIAHYGDSQIEGDRLTCFIRREFQNKFGGYGIGYIPFTDITTHHHLLRDQSDNWIRYSVFNNKYSSAFYCASGLLFKFKENEKSASITFNLYKTFQYRSIAVQYKAEKTCLLSTYDSKTGRLICSDTLSASPDFTVKTLSIPANSRDLRFSFNAEKSPDFYGFSIDGKGGVQMDNYSIRGHSGERINYADAGFVAKQLNYRNTKLLILQYGANVVPYFDTEKKCEYLEKVYYNLFMRYKNSLPGVSILVVGAGDMAYAARGEYQSYPNVRMVNEAQKRAALKAGCAFWDLYEAMGGSGSILVWAANGMAAKDGHFYTKGQQIVARQFFEALMSDYNNYLYRQISKQVAVK